MTNTIKCSINSPPSLQVVFFSNSVCFITEYLHEQLHKFDIALQTGFMTPEDWECFFIEAGISMDLAKTHATKFADEKLMIESLQMLDRSMRKELGVILMGEVQCIRKQAKEATTKATRIQAVATKRPHLNLEMTSQQFRKFQIDWDIFTKMTNMPSSQTNIHL